MEQLIKDKLKEVHQDYKDGHIDSSAYCYCKGTLGELLKEVAKASKGSE